MCHDCLRAAGMLDKEEEAKPDEEGDEKEKMAAELLEGEALEKKVANSFTPGEKESWTTTRCSQLWGPP